MLIVPDKDPTRKEIKIDDISPDVLRQFVKNMADAFMKDMQDEVQAS